MYDENQIVQMKWGRGNKRMYESKGYTFTKIGDVFNVFVRDLSSKSHARINILCDYCGEEYSAQFDNITKSRKTLNKDACSKCKTKKKSEILRKKNAKNLLGRAKDVCDGLGYELLTKEDEYSGSHMTIKINCKKHGVQNVNLWAFLNGAKCPPCSYEDRAIKNTLDVDYVQQYIDSLNNNELLNKDDYKTRKTPNLKIRCACGNVYTTSLGCYILGVQQCYSCSCKESKQEKRIREFLDKYGIRFKQEQKFEDCKDIHPLPFDFYIPQNNLLIEFDGQHHYEPVYGKEHHETTVKHDQIKNQYCKDNNINLLRIPYWEGNNIEEIIAKELKLNL